MGTRNKAYRATRATSTPKWSDDAAIAAVYTTAKRIQLQAGITMVVDHIYPLGGDTIGGLHVPGNLQILTIRGNCRKGRSMPGSRRAELWDTARAWVEIDNLERQSSGYGEAHRETRGRAEEMAKWGQGPRDRKA